MSLKFPSDEKRKNQLEWEESDAFYEDRVSHWKKWTIPNFKGGFIEFTEVGIQNSESAFLNAD